MTPQMLKLETSKMQKAIATAKTVRPRVRWTGERNYAVTGRKGDTYTVRFLINKYGTKLGECNCPAGKAAMYCYHIAAAAAVNIAIHSNYSKPSETPKALPSVPMAPARTMRAIHFFA
jgi:hypothetical protein